MNTFMLCPLQEGYSFTVGNNLREQQLEGGMPRQVVKFIGAVHTVNASILLKDRRARQYFWAFWRTNQGKNWLWELFLDNGNSEECECRFVSESLPTESGRGYQYLKMSFQILVMPIKRDSAFDQSIVELWQSGLINNLSDLEKIPNVWLPDALGV